MRTFLYKKLKRILHWLKSGMISGKTILTAIVAAIYLKTDVVTIYRLKDRYHLPSYKTKNNSFTLKGKKLTHGFSPGEEEICPGP